MHERTIEASRQGANIGERRSATALAQRREGDLLIAADGRLTAVEVKANGASLEVGRVQPLFGGLTYSTGPVPYDAAPGGQRFLVDVLTDRPAPEPLTVMQNWTAAPKT